MLVNNKISKLDFNQHRLAAGEVSLDALSSLAKQ